MEVSFAFTRRLLWKTQGKSGKDEIKESGRNEGQVSSIGSRCSFSGEMEEGDPSAEKVLIFSIRGHLVYKSLE
jgi:hypothetical protein